MNYSTAVFLINDNVRAINVVYEDKPNEAPVVYKTFDKSIEVDDLVVVPTNTRVGMTVVKVVEVDSDIDFDDRTEVKWIVGKVHKEDFDKIKSEEDKAIETIKAAEKRRKREELAAALKANMKPEEQSMLLIGSTVTKEEKEDKDDLPF